MQTTFSTASPFIQTTALPSPSTSTRTGTPETRIQSVAEGSPADLVPMELCWHIEDGEEVALGYERLKIGKHAKSEEPRIASDGIARAQQKVEAPPASALAAGSSATHEAPPENDSDAPVATPEKSSDVLVPIDHTLSIRGRPMRQAAAKALRSIVTAHPPPRTRRARRSDAPADENAPSPEKPGAHISDARQDAETGMAADDDHVKPPPSATSKPLKRKRASRGLGGAGSHAGGGTPTTTTCEDVEMDAGESQLASDVAHTSSGDAEGGPTKASRAPKKTSRRRSSTQKRAKSKSARKREVLRPPTPESEDEPEAPVNANESAPSAMPAQGQPDGEEESRKRPRCEDVHERGEPDSLPTLPQPSLVEVDAERQEPARGEVDGLSDPEVNVVTSKDPRPEGEEESDEYSRMEVAGENVEESRCSSPVAESPRKEVAGETEEPARGDAQGDSVAEPHGILRWEDEQGRCEHWGQDAGLESLRVLWSGSTDDEALSETIRMQSRGGGAHYENPDDTLSEDASGDPAPNVVAKTGDAQDAGDVEMAPGHLQIHDLDTSDLLSNAPPGPFVAPSINDDQAGDALPPSISFLEPRPQQSQIELISNLAESEMDAAVEAMLSGGALTEEQIAALEAHMFNIGSGWDTSAANGDPSLDLETHLPGLALLDWDMDGLMPDSAACMLGLEDYLATSHAHTSTPADPSELVPTANSLELDMLDLAAHLLPLTELEAHASSDFTTGTSLGHDLNLDPATLAATSDVPSLDLFAGVDTPEVRVEGSRSERTQLRLVPVDPAVFNTPRVGVLPQWVLNAESLRRQELGRETGVLGLDLSTPGRGPTPVQCAQAASSQTRGGPLQHNVFSSSRPIIDTMKSSSRLQIVNPVYTSGEPSSMLSVQPSLFPENRSDDLSVISLSGKSVTPATPRESLRRTPDYLSALNPPTAPLFAGETGIHALQTVQSNVSSTANESSSPSSPQALGPRLQPIPLPPPEAAPPSFAPLPTAPESTEASHQAEALKQSKKTVPVRRRIGVLRRYEEDHEWYSDEQLQGGTVGFRETSTEGVMGKSEEACGTAYGEGTTQVGHAGAGGREGRSDSDVEGGVPATQPEIIVIDDDEDEEVNTKSYYIGAHYWHWGQTTLDWKRGIGRNGRIVERAKEAAEARAREPSEIKTFEPSSSLAAPSEEKVEQSPEFAMHMSPTPSAAPLPTKAAPGSFSVPLTAAAGDPFDRLTPHSLVGNRMKAPRPSSALIPPVQAGAFDIDLGFGGPRDVTDPLSTPELSPGPSRSSDADSMECDRNQLSSWSDDLFGPDEDASERDDPLNNEMQLGGTAADHVYDHGREETCRRSKGGHLESGLSPLADFATLQLLP
ncbi:hypothetical protein EVJ58_g6488 [Rhodofomes roseus]|uniref:Uncharacterized protein n=1 Tax=Rhodofomes roseus TaxID=34475 RepID=A0A4Y9YA37_9APHY|nr:hypothetical protein EVJ58_g6488 [Rhodofomes roseus]